MNIAISPPVFKRAPPYPGQRMTLGTGSMHRLFVALRPPPHICERLFDTMDGVDGARWQDDEQLHLTLRYIGKVERAVAEDVAVALGDVRSPPLTLALSGVGSFQDRGRTDALWAGVTPRDGVVALHRKIDAALVRIGLPPEGRAYLPHITVARLGRSAGPVVDFLRVNAGLTSPAFTLEHFLLFESRIGRDGATYEAVARYPLQS